MTDQEMRINKIYDYLVKNTEIHYVFKNREKNELNGKLLELLNHIIDGDDSPLESWFETENS